MNNRAIPLPAGIYAVDARFLDMDDGQTPLGEFVKQLKALGLDFAAIVDHKQILHCLLPQWDDMLICGTEPGCTLNDPNRPMRSRKMDYCMLFRQPSDYFRVMEAKAIAPPVPSAFRWP